MLSCLVYLRGTKISWSSERAVFFGGHSKGDRMAVYTLELQGGNFYVGYSDDIPKRMAEHFLGRGSYWTRLHAPTKVLEVVPGVRSWRPRRRSR